MGDGPHLFWLVTLIGSCVAGFVVGLTRSWRYVLAGVVLPFAFLIGSAFASNDTLSGTEDLSWRILLIALAAEGGALFFVTLGLGAIVGTAARIWRAR